MEKLIHKPDGSLTYDNPYAAFLIVGSKFEVVDEDKAEYDGTPLKNGDICTISESCINENKYYQDYSKKHNQGISESTSCCVRAPNGGMYYTRVGVFRAV